MPKLLSMLEKQPDDVFLLYAIAMEHRKAGGYPEALDYLKRVLQRDPAYLAAYQQVGQVQELAGDMESAKAAYRQGVQAAAARGERHAGDEMAEALAALERRGGA
jgi:tetratricopeptide (TPR) repeat protein